MRTKRILSLALAVILTALSLVSLASCGNKMYKDKEFKVEEHYDGTYSLVDIFDTDITEITIPTEVKGKPITGVSGAAFNDCDKLEKIIFPEHITKITGISDDCVSLKEIVLKCRELPYSLNTSPLCEEDEGIAEGIKLTIASSVTLVSSKLLHDLNVKEVVFEEGCNPSLMNFEDCAKLQKVTFASTMESTSTFKNCPALTTVIIPEGVKYVGSLTNCTSLTSISLPSTVCESSSDEFMDLSHTFGGCSKLTDIYYEGSAAAWSLRDGVYYLSSNDSKFGTENPDYAKTGIYCTIHCTDGDIQVKKYK